MNRLISRRNRQDQERGFTLLELMIAVLIIGLLTSVSVPIFKEQHRQAIIATIKSDIMSSVPVAIKQLNTPGHFVTAEEFHSVAAITRPNNIVLVVNGDVACIWGSHAFSDTDIVSFHYSSATSQLGDGGCLGEIQDDSEIIVGTGPDTDDPVTPENEEEEGYVNPPIEEHEEETPEPTTPPVTPPAGPSEPTYEAQGNKYPVCHKNGGGWQFKMLPLPAIQNGHTNHGDVIPPIAGKFGGSNWNASGWTTFVTHCS